jgi:hypothetical protein
MRKGFLTYGEMRKYLTIYDLLLLPSEFPYIRGKFDYLFYQCGEMCILLVQMSSICLCGA